MDRVFGSMTGSIVVSLCLSVAVLSAAENSAVADAVMRGDHAAVEMLVAQHADVNAPQADGATALQWAVFASDKAMVDLLLRAGANPKAANRDGSTPLWLASINGDAPIIAALLKAGADANEHLPLGRSPLMVASRTGNVDAVKVLLDHGADVNAKETLRGTTPLMWAADEGHAAAIQLLIEHGADIKARSDKAERGRGPALGKSNDPRKAVEALGKALAAGIPTPQLGAVGTTSLIPAVPEKGGGARRGKAGAGAAGALDEDDAAAAFGFGGRRPAPKDGGGLTALVYAALADHVESVKVLLAAGADINQVTDYGWSALLVATQNRYYKLGAYLVNHGADVNIAN